MIANGVSGSHENAAAAVDRRWTAVPSRATYVDRIKYSLLFMFLLTGLLLVVYIGTGRTASSSYVMEPAFTAMRNDRRGDYMTVGPTASRETDASTGERVEMDLYRSFQLVDIPDAHYIINNDLCKSDDIFIVAFIHSAPKNLDNRNSIRSAWGNWSVLSDRGLQVRTAFLIAAVDNAELQQNIAAESGKYGDIVQGSFVDAYRNLTYKQVMGMHWTSTYCPQAKFVLKTDDDIYVDIFQLTNLLWQRRHIKDLVFCNIWVGMPVLRDKNSKWYVSEQEYKGKVYEPYCSGWGFVLTPSAAAKIYNVSRSIRYFWVDDAWVSGRMIDMAGLKREGFNDKFVFGTKELEKWAKDNKSLTASPFIIGATWSSKAFMSNFWAKTIRYENEIGLAKWKKLIKG